MKENRNNNTILPGFSRNITGIIENYRYSRFFSYFANITVFPEICRFTNENDDNEKFFSRHPGMDETGMKSIPGTREWTGPGMKSIPGYREWTGTVKNSLQATGIGR